MVRQAQKNFDKNGKQIGWKIKYRYKDYSGKTINSTKSGFKKKKDAEVWLSDFMKSKSFDLNMKLKDYAEIYFRELEPRIRESSFTVKKNIIYTKVIPYFGEMVMSDISPTDIYNWQNTLIKMGFKPTYLKTIQTHFSALFNHACKYHGLKSNPCRKAGSMGKAKREEVTIWTKEEFQNVTDCLFNKRTNWTAITVLYWTGMRVGELLALRISDVNFEKNEININKSYQRLKGKDVITEPKTPKSKRIITIPIFISDILKEYISSMYDVTKNARLFNTTKISLERDLVRCAKESNVKRIRLHDLRHSHASLLIELGWSPVSIAERLGHENITTTLNTYSHLFPNSQKELADSLNKFYKKGL